MFNAIAKRDILIQHKRALQAGLDRIYSFLLAACIAAHVVFIAFLFIKNIEFRIICIYAAFAFALLFLKIYYKDRLFREVVILWLHIILIFEAIFGTMLFGWGHGFGNLLIWLIATNYFLIFKSKIFTFGIILIEFSVYIALYLGRDYLGLGFLAAYQDAVFMIIFLFMFVTFFVLSELLNSIITDRNLKIILESDRLKRISEYDFLTGLKNRRSVQDELTAKFNSNLSGGLLVALGDIDDFKGINDTFGHEAGDKILKKIAAILKKNFRSNDMVYRWGGEEFLFAASCANEQIAAEIMQRVLKSISSNVSAPDGSSVTMTFGAVLFRGNFRPGFDSVIKLVDELMYEGKRSGKNCIKFKTWNVC